VVLLLAVVWSPFLGNLGTIFELINQMFSIFAPSIVAVFLLGIISSKGTANAAFYTLLGGSLFAASVFCIEKYLPIGGISNYISSADGLGINWLKQTYLFFIFSTLLYAVISIFDKNDQVISPGFYLRISSPSPLVIWLSGVLLLVMLILYWTFY